MRMFCHNNLERALTLRHYLMLSIFLTTIVCVAMQKHSFTQIFPPYMVSEILIALAYWKEIKEQLLGAITCRVLMTVVVAILFFG